MSRRQSRVSVDTRQTDTLLEFETCESLPRLVRSAAFSPVIEHAAVKKKFLLANKHITK